MSQASVHVQQIEGDAYQVTLPSQLTIGSCSALHEELTRIVESTSIVVFDAAGVERVDTAGLQLLVAFAHERRDQSLLTELRGVSPSLAESMRLLGLQGLFG